MGTPCCEPQTAFRPCKLASAVFKEIRSRDAARYSKYNRQQSTGSVGEYAMLKAVEGSSQGHSHEKYRSHIDDVRHALMQQHQHDRGVPARLCSCKTAGMLWIAVGGDSVLSASISSHYAVATC